MRTAPDRRPATGPFAAMIALDPVASRLPDRTGVCAARGGVPLSQREEVTGQTFDRQIGSAKRGDRYADCRIRTGFPFDRHICYATGDRKWSSGESRMRVSEADPAAPLAKSRVCCASGDMPAPDKATNSANALSSVPLGQERTS